MRQLSLNINFLDRKVPFQKFLVFWNQRLKLHKNVPEHFPLSRQKNFKNYGRIMVESDSMTGF